MRNFDLTGSNLRAYSPRNNLLRNKMLSAQKTPHDMMMDALKERLFSHDWQPKYWYGGAFGWDRSRLVEKCSRCDAYRERNVPMPDDTGVPFMAGFGGAMIDNDFKKPTAECPWNCVAATERQDPKEPVFTP